MNTYVNRHIHIYVHAHIRTYIHTYIYTYIHTQIVGLGAAAVIVPMAASFIAKNKVYIYIYV